VYNLNVTHLFAAEILIARTLFSDTCTFKISVKPRLVYDGRSVNLHAVKRFTLPYIDDILECFDFEPVFSGRFWLPVPMDWAHLNTPVSSLQFPGALEEIQ